MAFGSHYFGQPAFAGGAASPGSTLFFDSLLSASIQGHWSASEEQHWFATQSDRHWSADIKR